MIFGRAWSCLLVSVAAVAANPGEELYRLHCSPCHGVSGEGGKGPMLATPRLPRAMDDAALSSVITLGLSGTAMPGTRMTAAENRALTAYVRSLGKRAPEVTSGNPGRGEALFWGRANCGQCHAVSARGGISGPELTGIGVRRGASHLRQSLLEPAAETPDNFGVYRKVIPMPDNYLQVEVETSDGRRTSGIRMNEDTFSIQIREADGALRFFRKAELRRVEKRWGHSPMPEYRGILKPGELEDVIAYLLTLGGEP